VIQNIPIFILILISVCLSYYLLTLSYNRHKKQHAIPQFIEALRYKLEGLGPDSRFCHCILNLTLIFGISVRPADSKSCNQQVLSGPVISLLYFYDTKEEVKYFHYMPGPTHSVPGGSGSHVST
jgi:hypothetical protein